MNFTQLKKNSKKSFDKLKTELDKMKSPQGANTKDDRFWNPTVDKAGNGYAVIRFLPAPPDEDLPYVRMFDHAFQGPGGWYIEKSRMTIGESDPVSEYNVKLWNTGLESNKAQVRKQKRKLSFISNIEVIKDPAAPENEGKVFLYRYGKKIFDKINEKMAPQFEDEESINPFDFWQGANFKLKIRNVEGYRNYDKSEFDDPSPHRESDQELEAIWKTQYSLKAFHDLKEFKSYDELSARLAKVLGGSKAPSSVVDADEEEETEAPTSRTASARKAPKEDVPFDVDEEDVPISGSKMDYFRKLAEEG